MNYIQLTHRHAYGPNNQLIVRVRDIRCVKADFGKTHLTVAGAGTIHVYESVENIVAAMIEEGALISRINRDKEVNLSWQKQTQV